MLGQIRRSAASLYTGKTTDSNDPLIESRKLGASLERLETSILKEKAVLSAKSPAKVSSDTVVARSGELIAYYFLGRDQSWLWAITENDITTYTLPSEREVLGLVHDYLAIILKPPAERIDTSAWEQREIVDAISNIVLAPLVTHLESNEVTHISFVADGALLGVPFAALKLNGERESLIERYPVSYLPSLSTRAALNSREKRRPSKITGDVLVFANPLNSSHLGTLLKPLPYTANEASEIVNVFGAKATVMQAEAATRENFLSSIQEPHSILHIATHGLVNHQEPVLSSLVFSASEDSDGLLLLPEISALEFNTSLLVLSACDSGVGRAVAGEGFISLSRAFLGSGVNQVMGSLWQVQDSSTATLMQEFYIAFKARWFDRRRRFKIGAN